MSNEKEGKWSMSTLLRCCFLVEEVQELIILIDWMNEIFADGGGGQIEETMKM